MEQLLWKDCVLEDALNQDLETQIVTSPRKLQVSLPTQLWMTREKGEQKSPLTQKREVGKREETAPPRAWESCLLYQMCSISLASSAAQQPPLLSPLLKSPCYALGSIHILPVIHLL